VGGGEGACSALAVTSNITMASVKPSTVLIRVFIGISSRSPWAPKDCADWHRLSMAFQKHRASRITASVAPTNRDKNHTLLAPVHPNSSGMDASSLTYSSE